MAHVDTRDGINQLVGDTPPSTVGKFLDGKGLVAMLKNKTMKFCPPKELNDGWDCVPLQFRVEDVRRAWEKSQLHIINPACQEWFFDSYLNRDWKPFRDLLSTIIGVASFTDLKMCDQELMWERYGDDHKGGIVVLNTRTMGTFLRVDYQTRPEISIPMENDSFPFEEIIPVFTTKEPGSPNHWEKESEWRKVAKLNQLEQFPICGKTLFVRRCPEAFSHVICGRNMNPEVFQAVSILSNSFSNPLRISRE